MGRNLPVGAAVGARVHALLWAKRTTQATLARELGITATTLSKKLRGAVPITVDELARIAELLGVEVGELLGEEPVDPAACVARVAATG